MPRAAWKARRRRRARSSSKSTAASALDALDGASSEPVEATDALALNTSATSTLARGRGRRGRDGSLRLISGGVNFGGGGGRGRRAAGGSSTGAEESFDATDADADDDADDAHDDADVDANVWERARANHPSRKHPLVVVVAKTLDVTRNASLTRRISRASQSKVRFAIRCAAPSDFDSGFLQRQKDDRTDGCADEREREQQAR
jgi:hypothetical protein